MGLKGLGRCIFAGSLGLVASLYFPPETKAAVVMSSVTNRDVYTPGDLINVKVRLDNTNHVGEVFSAEYILGVSSFLQEEFRGPPSTNGFIAEYTFSTIGAPVGPFTLELTHTNVYDHNVNLQSLIVQNGEIKITYPGDASLNYQVSIGDVTILAENFGQPGGWEQGDFTREGFVSIGDLTILAENFGAGQAQGNYLANVVPAPSTFVSGLAFLGLGLSGRRRYPNKTLAEIAQGK